jgi:hypothetical protein
MHDDFILNIHVNIYNFCIHKFLFCIKGYIGEPVYPQIVFPLAANNNVFSLECMKVTT